MFNVNKDDKDYMDLVNEILNHEAFKQTKAISQHGTTTFSHSLRVSYSAYKATRFFKLDYKAAAVSG
jgi:HD superfamily phosphodiesterase